MKVNSLKCVIYSRENRTKFKDNHISKRCQHPKVYRLRKKPFNSSLSSLRHIHPKIRSQVSCWLYSASKMIRLRIIQPMPSSSSSNQFKMRIRQFNNKTTSWHPNSLLMWSTRIWKKMKQLMTKLKWIIKRLLEVEQVSQIRSHAIARVTNQRSNSKFILEREPQQWHSNCMITNRMVIFTIKTIISLWSMARTSRLLWILMT